MVHWLTQTLSLTLEMRASFASVSCVFRDESVIRSEAHEPSKPAQAQRERKVPINDPNDELYAFCTPKHKR